MKKAGKERDWITGFYRVDTEFRVEVVFTGFLPSFYGDATDAVGQSE